MHQRRFLPPIAQLLAFDAVARHGSVTAAAQELHLTQSTVSRQILSLEQQLGRELFLRQRKRLMPNAAAIAYREEISRALDRIQAAGLALLANPGGGTLSLAVLPTFATRWLAPRLGQFLEQHPGIAVNLSTRIRRFSFDSESFDAAIYFGAPDWPGVERLKLFDEALTACAAPDFLARHPVHAPEDLRDLPLLRLESRATGWRDWFRGQGTEAPDAAGMVMDQFSMMIQAAISGLGIALLPDYLAQVEIAEGRLAPVLRQAIPGTGAYWLVWPGAKDGYPPIVALRDWLTEQSGARTRDALALPQIGPGATG